MLYAPAVQVDAAAKSLEPSWDPDSVTSQPPWSRSKIKSFGQTRRSGGNNGAIFFFCTGRIDPALLPAHLPSGRHADLLDGQAWLAVVPFAMERVHPVRLPPVPWISWLLELNVRTYAHDDAGRPGVWFFSLDGNFRVLKNRHATRAMKKTSLSITPYDGINTGAGERTCCRIR